MKGIAKAVPGLLFFLLGSLPMFGQLGTQGAILGVVTDQTGAVISGANVTVTNTGTGLKLNAVTNDTGDFEVLALPIGTYSVTVGMQGFRTWTLATTQLTVGERKRLSPKLEVGEVTERVNVETTAELVQTERGAVDSVVEQRQIRDLPLNGRNPVELVNLVPGVRFLGRAATDRDSTVQGNGNRSDGTEFQIDGLAANAGLDERGVGIPNVDTIAEFKVETSNFGAENGRHPLQVLMVTKSGTNGFHGTLWEFLRNEKLDSFNTFAKLPGARKPKLSQNQFGVSAGGPIIKNKTHFFGAYEGTRIRRATIYNSLVPSLAQRRGDFSAVPRDIRDPLTGQPFPGNQIPANRFSSAALFFFPYLLTPNSGVDRFRTTAPTTNDVNEYTIRIDHQITSKQRIYWRGIIIRDKGNTPNYSPDVVNLRQTPQHNYGVSYNYTISPSTLLTVDAGTMQSVIQQDCACVGGENLTQKAGIRGFPTEGRGASVGLPNSVGIAGYTGFGTPFGVPYRLWWTTAGGKASLNMIRGSHTINAGYQFHHLTTFGRHSSGFARGAFTFNGQYTGDGFADYMLGLMQSGSRNYPLQTFGTKDAPYSAPYVQDYWKVTRNLTLNFGLRYDYWHAKDLVRGNAASFDLKRGKIIAGVDKNGKVDLGAQPVAPFLAAATAGQWVPATEVGAPHGLFAGNGYLSPRLGFAWRVRDSNDLVIRGGYGIFASSFPANRSASAIVGPPYWTWETQIFGGTTLQPWETAWPDDPRAFITPSVVAPDIYLKAQKTHQWNVSIQKSLPLQSAITVSYVGNRSVDAITQQIFNEVAPGVYPNLQNVRPYPLLAGGSGLYINSGRTWYNALQAKVERRFVKGLSTTMAYSYSKLMLDGTSTEHTSVLEPFAPAGYNRGRSDLDRTHLLAWNFVWEIPIGRGRRLGSNMHPVLNAIAGGWQANGIYLFQSGAPLTFIVPGATLGNGRNTRANASRKPTLSNPTPALYFDTTALSAPPPTRFGGSALGMIDGPARHQLDAGLTKNFYVKESRYLQFRWEMFNAPNHVNYGNPNTTLNQPTTGRILTAGGAREMQIGLKFIF
ncbi:MAG TPA: carboxypeptidase regulatory-like domain-containing protein [Bryobacteraceae bacterium]|nr:carboxypeptidase regulatory-like domain-containing protein [Bryobacteraceae bacterium]